MCVWGDSGMRSVNGGNTVTRLEFAFALDTLRSQTIVAFLLKVRRCTQIEYNNYRSLLSATRIADDGAKGTHKLVRIHRNRFPAYKCLRI
jgi:hypothetical protein